MVIKEGRIIATGHPQELLKYEDLLDKDGLEMPLILQLSKKMELEVKPDTMAEFFSMS